jgi:hypothetical protein
MHTKIRLFFFLLTVIVFYSCSDEETLIDSTLGIGNYLKQEIDNGVPYNWYYDQGTSGEHSQNNCGPACVTMALKWDDKSWDKPVEYFRRGDNEKGEWWSTLQIRDTLKKYNLNCIKKNFNQQSFKADIQYGHLVILCVDISYIAYNDDSFHYGRFYEAQRESGHFIIVKGYKQTDTGLWLEIYDPLSNGEKYQNGTLKGVDRYYHISDIIEATDNWWKYYIKIKLS